MGGNHVCLLAVSCWVVIIPDHGVYQRTRTGAHADRGRAQSCFDALDSLSEEVGSVHGSGWILDANHNNRRLYVTAMQGMHTEMFCRASILSALTIEGDCAAHAPYYIAHYIAHRHK